MCILLIEVPFMPLLSLLISYLLLTSFSNISYLQMNKLVAVHILLLLGADTHTLVNSQGHSASVLSESLLQRTTTSLLLETPRFLLPKLDIHDTPRTVKPVSTLVFKEMEEDKQRQNRGFPTKGRKQVCTIP